MTRWTEVVAQILNLALLVGGVVLGFWLARRFGPHSKGRRR